MTLSNLLVKCDDRLFLSTLSTDTCEILQQIDMSNETQIKLLEPSERQQI